jgi:hypothetical protein
MKNGKVKIMFKAVKETKNFTVVGQANGGFNKLYLNEEQIEAAKRGDLVIALE